MKNLFAATALLGLLAVAPAALAQDDHHQGGNAGPGGGGDQMGHAGAQADRPAGGAHTGAPQVGHANPGPNTARPTLATPNVAAHDAAVTSHSHNGVMSQGVHEARTPGPQGAAAGNHSANAFTNTGAHNAAATHTSRAGVTHQSPAIAALRRNVQAPRHFQAGAYRAPQGYAPRHWSYGQRLPNAYFARNYWITDFLDYALFAPPPGLVWVRVGDDALLIDEYSGEIIQVEYGVFY
jgi:Ni/Co efflux regulator RcnB